MRTLIYFELPNAESARLYGNLISANLRELIVKISGRIEVYGYWNENKKPALAIAINAPEATDCSRTIVEYLRWYRGYVIAYAFDRGRCIISKKFSAITETYDCPSFSDFSIYERVAKLEARRLYICITTSLH